MRKRRIIPTLPVNFFEDTDNKDKYQKMLYSSIVDGVEQTLKNGKPSFIMARVSDGKSVNLVEKVCIVISSVSLARKKIRLEFQSMKAFCPKTTKKR